MVKKSPIKLYTVVRCGSARAINVKIRINISERLQLKWNSWLWWCRFTLGKTVIVSNWNQPISKFTEIYKSQKSTECDYCRARVCVCAMCMVELGAHLLQDSSKVQFRIIIKWNPMRFSVLNVQFIEVEKSNNTTLYVCSAHLLYSNIKRIHSQKHIQTPILFMHFDIFRIQMGSYVRCH